ncbi:MAG: hypothetical protein L0271_18555 [Gemmatimonadetes bacterium]|nr:hypothetical protein [Gemmatimonadota bacterium]
MQDDRSEQDEDLFQELERRALLGLPDDEAEPVDVVDALRDEPEPAAQPAEDATLGGYMRKHGRVPAFEGRDGQPYTVDIDVEAQPEGGWVSFLVFLRWAATGAGIMDHVESGDVGRGATEEEARQAALELSLYEVRVELDAAIERKTKGMEAAEPG